MLSKQPNARQRSKPRAPRRQRYTRCCFTAGTDATTYLQHGDEFLFGDAHAVAVGRVHNIDDGVRVRVVATPIWPVAARHVSQQDTDSRARVNVDSRCTDPDVYQCCQQC